MGDYLTDWRREENSYSSEDCSSDQESELDEYLGLMSANQREWLLALQFQQINEIIEKTGDFYYQAWLKKHTNNKHHKLNNNNIVQNNFACLNQIKNSNSENNLIVDFENSLGSISKYSCLTPRRRASQFDLQTFDGKHTQNITYIKILLEIEDIFLMVLNLEEMTVGDFGLRTVSNMVENIFTKLKCCSLGNVLCVRKGKLLLLRILPYMLKIGKIIETSCLWFVMGKMFHKIVIRDKNDGLLNRFVTYFNTWASHMGLFSLSQVLYLFLPSQTNKNTRPLTVALNTETGMGILCSIIAHGEEAYDVSTEEDKFGWDSVLHELIQTVAELEQLPTNNKNTKNQISVQIFNRIFVRCPVELVLLNSSFKQFFCK